MEYVDLGPDISLENVNSIVGSVKSAFCLSFQDEPRVTMKRSSSGKDRFIGKEKGISYLALYKEKIKKIKERFPDLDPKIFDGPKSSVLVYAGTDESGNCIVSVFCNTTQDAAGRFTNYLFELNFEKNVEKARELVSQIRENKMGIKSVMDRVFSKDGTPNTTILKGSISYGEGPNAWKGLSPFLHLPKAQLSVKTEL